MPSDPLSIAIVEQCPEELHYTADVEGLSGLINTASAKRVINEGCSESFGHRRNPHDLQATHDPYRQGLP
jgi:hypothetical protein